MDDAAFKPKEISTLFCGLATMGFAPVHARFLEVTAMKKRLVLLFLAGVSLIAQAAIAAEVWPALPAADGKALIPAQEWPQQPGPRSVTAYVRYPKERREAVNAETGLMLTLHNWGGTDHRGAPNPRFLADRYNVVAISVDYLQSGKFDPETEPPYDSGYLQALDALRALYWVWQGLEDGGIDFAKDRIYTTGGSGGGNVSLMAMKLAPRTFAAVIACSAMAKLSDDIAFDLDGGSRLNAGYRRDPDSERHLSPDFQAIRFIGHPKHLRQMRALENAAKILVVHGASDATCPIEDIREMITNFQAVGLDVEPHVIDTDQLDGKIFKDTGHSIGNRTQILSALADAYLLPDSPEVCRRKGTSDFERPANPVRYDTKNGHFLIDYAKGYPEARFVVAER
jgi:predicted esterase